ncbi:PD-(D/E)XK nuclease family protein [Lacisediminihabitans sp.]|uniref:PD-(D/E)XK nuclease family protein n=1 Tax=Lacisediminihabitans sp. TaxID=2787631 RepID=UPI00374CD70C
MAIKGFRRAAVGDSRGGSDSNRLVPDAAQRAVLQLADGASAAVIGAPGTGKTTTLVELVADRVLDRGWSAEQVIVLTSSRTTATALRDRLALRLGVPTNGPLARTVNSLAFEIVGAAAASAGVAPPRLVTGGEQDADIGQLLEGQIEDGVAPAWPPHLDEDVRRLRAFRTELRELIMRATEYGVTPQRLATLGADTGHPEWVAAAAFISDYLSVVSSSRPGQLDSAELVQFAIAALGRGEAGERVAGLRLVVVDDLQEATKSTISLLAALAARGVSVVAFGDPDVATNAFRGGEPDALGRLGSVLGVPDLVTITLGTAHRQGATLREFTARVTERIGTAGAVGQRAAVAGTTHGPDRASPVLRITATSQARQWAAIARQLREHHLIGGIPLSGMAVVVRSGALVPVIARALALNEVPTRTAVGGRALRDDHAARSLLSLVDVGIGRTPLTGALAAELLLGPFGGLDHLALRRLRLALRAEELAGGRNRASDDLLVEGLGAPGRFATIDHRVGRNAERLSATLGAVGALAADGGTIEELLWLAWHRSGLADDWFAQATSAGITAAEANRNLDGIVALFTSARRFTERRPGTGPSVFLDDVLDAEVPEDTLSPQSAAEAVLVTTPSGAVGLEVDVVVIAALQEGVWPNLRLRGSLLNPQDLVRVMTGLDDVVIDERRQVRDDELRMFALAVSRARQQVILAAVSNEDDAASVLFALTPPGTPVVDAATVRPLSLRALTGRLRRELVQERRTAPERAAVASALARLAEERVPGANPAEWHGLLEPSTTEPLFDGDETVPVSPSKLDAFEQSPLDWFIDTVSGTQSSTAMGLGTIVHWAMETATDSSVDTVWRAIEQRWSELYFESPWFAEQQRSAARILAAGVADYLADFEREGKSLVAAEGRFSLKIDRATVNGSIDRVERSSDGSVVIVDLKTGTPTVRQQVVDAHPQLGAYQLAYSQGVLDEFLDDLGEHSGGGAKLLFVKKGKKKKLYQEGVQAPLDEEALEGFRARIRQAALGMAAAAFEGAVELSEWGGFDIASRKLHRVRAVSSD